MVFLLIDFQVFAPDMSSKAKIPKVHQSTPVLIGWGSNPRFFGPGNPTVLDKSGAPGRLVGNSFNYPTNVARIQQIFKNNGTLVHL